MAKKKSKKSWLIKLLLSFIYLGIIFILVYSAYQLFLDDQKEINWKDVKETDEYAWLEIYQMSEAFAEIDEKQIHFVMEKEETGAWHTYLIAIDKGDYNKYKDIIDYTYERTAIAPKSVRVYGYPVEINEELKKLAIQNITNFVPVENQIVITTDNFETYLTNTYLDTTIEKVHLFNNSILILLLMALILFIILIMTIFDKKPDKSKRVVFKKGDRELSLEKEEKRKSTKKEVENNLEENKTSPKLVEKERSKRKKVPTEKVEKNKKEKESVNKNQENKNKDDDLEII